MEPVSLDKRLLERFPFTPTQDQQTVIKHLTAFDASTKEHPLYILKGYAGTGKTTLISIYIKELKATKRKCVLMAPTGRAAKVLSHYTGYKAHTIHRIIYSIQTNSSNETKIYLNSNKAEDTVFVVDEASMIGDNATGTDSFSSRNLLDDLVKYVFSGSNNRLIFIGDTAQLPPVGLNLSPALNLTYLKSLYPLTAYSYEMTEVMRQALDSGILSSATGLRQKLQEQNTTLPILLKSGFKNDVSQVEDAMEMQELFQEYFYGDKVKESIVVCRSNKRANQFNEQIRNRILQRESQLEAGDLLMVVKNNYFWLDQKSPAGFVANGDIVEIRRVIGFHHQYGFDFAEADIIMIDYPEQKSMRVMLLLDTLYVEKANIDYKETRKLFEGLQEEYAFLKSKRKIMDAIKTNPYYNALQIKFAYAMTCHKTQGGQWNNVFVDQGYLTDDMLNIEYLRWLYTAFTRATERLYLIGFNNDMIG